MDEEIAWPELMEALFEGAKWTVGLSGVALAGGLVIGLLLVLLRMSGFAPIRWLYRGYVELFQGTPLLMQLFLVFYGLPMLEIEVSQWTAATIALTLHASAYLADIWLGCIKAIPQTQWASSASLGLTRFQQLRYVIGPQAARIGIAPSVGFLVQLIKGTALASIIGVVDLTKTGNMLANLNAEPSMIFMIYGVVGLMYFAMCFPLTWASRMLEARTQRHG